MRITTVVIVIVAGGLISSENELHTCKIEAGGYTRQYDLITSQINCLVLDLLVSTKDKPPTELFSAYF